MNLHQHFAPLRRRSLYLLELKDISGPIFFEDNRLHSDIVPHRDDDRGGRLRQRWVAHCSKLLPWSVVLYGQPTICVICFARLLSTCVVQRTSPPSTTKARGEKINDSTTATPTFWIHFPIPMWTENSLGCPAIN